MKILATLGLFAALVFTGSSAYSCGDMCDFSSSDLISKSAGSEWAMLLKGNRKFMVDPIYEAERAATAPKQNPNTVVLSCSDSRVPPEIIFNQGIGELFVVRVAGQVVDDIVVDSIEFAVGHYDVNTLLVMGHTHCGAVIGALEHLKRNHGKVDPMGPGHLNAVLIPIETAIRKAKINIFAKDALRKSIHANIRYAAKQLLANSPVIRDAIAKGKIALIGAEYNLHNGKVHKLFKFVKKHK